VHAGIVGDVGGAWALVGCFQSVLQDLQNEAAFRYI